MSTMIERRTVRGGGGDDPVPLPPPAPNSLPTSTELPTVLSPSYQAAMRRVLNCPPECLCRGANTSHSTWNGGAQRAHTNGGNPTDQEVNP